MADTKTEETPIVIVGGGIAGLSTACLLAQHNTKCIVIEKHAQSSVHPRAVGFTTRTMEIFSQLGIADQIPQVTSDFRLRRIQVESLAGTWGEELGKRGGHNQPSTHSSPFLGAAIAQDRLEPILRQRAEELGCDIRFGHRMLDFQLPLDDTELIKMVIRDPSGNEYNVATQYLVAADGHRSTICETLQIPTSGRGYLQTLKSVLFRAPSLDKYLEQGFHQFMIKQEDGFGGFLTTYNDSRWVLMFNDDNQRTEVELGEAILKATGVADLEFEVLATGSWDLQARIAENFTFPTNTSTNPRVFLMGDAAHTLPPTRGGYGANTGIGDAHNLAWKLASVVSRTSGPELLKSYDAERRAVAWVRHDQTFAGPDYGHHGRPEDDFGELRDPLAVELGQVYESNVIVSDEKNSESRPLTLNPDEAKGRPGARAPHIVLSKKGSKFSSLDLFGSKWTTLTGERTWALAARDISQQLNFPLAIILVPNDDFEEDEKNQLVKALGIEEHGVSLIRPDGHVAWRARAGPIDDQARGELMDALKQTACLVSTS